MALSFFFLCESEDECLEFFFFLLSCQLKRIYAGPLTLFNDECVTLHFLKIEFSGVEKSSCAS